MKKVMKSILLLLLTVSLFACTSKEASTGMKSFKQEVSGYGGKMVVEVQFDDKSILDVKVLENNETPTVASDALEKMPKMIIDNQSVSVDVVTGATFTSNAILEAVKLSIKEAGLDGTMFTKIVSKELVEKEAVDTDIVIVGGGIAGLLAAYEIKNSNPEIEFILVEKLNNFGGSIATTGGAIYGTNSNIHKKNDAKESTIEDIVSLFEYTSNDEVNKEIIKAVFSLSESTIDLLESYGAPYTGSVEFSSPYSDKLQALRFEGKGQGFQEFLEKMVEDNPFDLRLNTKATQLLTENNKVVGIKVEDESSIYNINAKSVILATGGFGSNPELMKKYATEYADGVIATNGGAKGDGFLLTSEFNDQRVGYGTMGSLVASDKSALIPSTFMFNLEGKRFVNETSPLYVRQRAVVEQKEGTAYVLADSSSDDLSAYEQAVSNGTAQKYETLNELAKAINIDVDSIKKELEEYNKSISNKDVIKFDLPLEKAIAVEEAPFYVQKTHVRTFGTITSIIIDENMQVLDDTNNKIDGLYACGELTVGNAFTKEYPGIGIGISYAANSGVLSAKKAIKNVVD